MEEGLYYPCSENKGSDQLRGYREADLRLCFRICKIRFLTTRLNYDAEHLKGAINVLVNVFIFQFAGRTQYQEMQ